MDTTTVTLNFQHVQLLLGVIYEYRMLVGFDEDTELADSVEEMLENAENDLFINRTDPKVTG